MTDTKELRERLAGLLEKATPGDWFCYETEKRSDCWRISDREDFVAQLFLLREDDHSLLPFDRAEENAALIVAMKNALPLLLSEASAREAEIARLREARRLDVLVLTQTKSALLSLPEDALGIAESGGAEWPIRDEMITAIDMRLNTEPTNAR
jgi:hypothetical protein